MLSTTDRADPRQAREKEIAMVIDRLSEFWRKYWTVVVGIVVLLNVAHDLATH